MKNARFASLFLFSSLFVLTIQGQVAATPEVGANPYKAYSGGAIDHIQMQNGQPYIRIPLASFPQLGKLSLSFSLLSNGSSWVPVSYCEPDYGPCTYTYGLKYICGEMYLDGSYSGDIMGGGGANVTPIDDQQLSYCESIGLDVYNSAGWCPSWSEICNPPGIGSDPIGTYLQWATYDVFDDSGAAHEMGYAGTNYANLSATDGSGYKLSLGPPGTTWDLNQAGSYQPVTSYTITEPSGITHATTVSTTVVSGITNTTTSTVISDLNANHVTFTESTSPLSTTITDSLGRTMPDIDTANAPQSSSTTGCPDLQIPGQPAVGSSTWQVPGPNGQSVTYLFCYANVPISTNFFGLHGGSETNCNSGTDANGDPICLYVTFAEISTTNQSLQSVVLPNGTYWGFGYDTTATGQDRYGDLTEIRLPSGGEIQYTYGSVTQCGWPDAEGDIPQERAILQRVELPLVGPSVTRTYSYTPTQTIETDVEGNQTVHNFTLDYPTTPMCGASETSTLWYQGAASSSKVPLRSESTSYRTTPDPQDDPYNVRPALINRLPTSKTITQDGQTVENDSYGYDSAFTDTEFIVYTVVDAPPQSVYLSGVTAGISYQTPSFVDDGVRGTATTRLDAVNSSYATANVLDRPQTTAICSSGQAKASCLSSAQSKTIYGYDESGSPQGIHGNQTSVSRYLAGGQNSVTSTVYNSLGMPISVTDPLGNQGATNHTTTYNYDSTGLFVTSRVQPTTNGIQHTDYFAQDPTTGWLMAYADQNASGISDTAHLTAYSYDNVGRLTEVNYPDGGEVQQCYTDTGGNICTQATKPPYSLYSAKKQSTGVSQTSLTEFDGLGRPTQTQLTSDPSGIDYVDTTYDDLGQVQSVSNPYRSTGDSTYGITSYTYDALGRKRYQCQPDNGSNTPCVAKNSYLEWDYTGNVTTAYDELRNKWQRTTDALGRLTNVVEPSGANTGYIYDALDNLLTVNQNGVKGDTSRIRNFNYDSLSRLHCASNPENSSNACPTSATTPLPSGVTGYTYDANGNLTSKTDPRSITTNYHYDALNRLLSITYTNDTTGTASSCYQYDGASTANLIGRLINQWTQAASLGACAVTLPSTGYLTLRSILAYDSMGRIKSEQQCTKSNCVTGTSYSPAYTYDLAGNILTHSDGVGMRVFTNCYDAANHLLSVVSVSATCPATLSASTALFSSPGYNPAGGLTAATFGAGLQLSRSYDSRLRVTSETDIGNAAPSAPGSAILTITGTEHIQP